MSFRSVLLRAMPPPLRRAAIKHQEMVKFAVVGTIAYVVDNGTWYVLKLTILDTKPVIAKATSVILATIASYILNREWSFDTRGGRERHHEAALFFAISGISILFYTAPVGFSRYVLHLQEPHVSAVTEEISDFLFGSIIGTLIAMAFRWWAFKKWVFPDADARVPRTDHVLGKILPYRRQDPVAKPDIDGVQDRATN